MPEDEDAVADDALDALARDLGVARSDVPFLDRLDAAALATLHAALHDARTRQERALAEAFEGTIRLVPRPLRGRVRRLLVGS